MHIEYDPELIEHTVFMAGQKDPDLSAELHQSTDQLYGLRGERERHARFWEVFKTFFQRLGLDELIPRLLAERSLTELRIHRCLISEAPHSMAEGAELYVKNDKGSSDDATRTLSIRVCPQSLLDISDLAPRLRRELLHVADMLDERFAYDKRSLTGHHPRQNLIRDRYRVLWDIHVEGRLFREGHRDDRMRIRLSHQLERVFTRYSACLFPPVLERVFNADHLTHRQLLEWASTPERLYGESPGGDSDASSAPGTLCPICGFSTYDWFELGRSLDEFVPAVQRDHPQWTAAKGMCRQCAEIYRANGRTVQSV